ncbi:hypothetical protein MTAT_26040 [Moorella thermoacetica]|uniref:Uncharacterized protein n=1 Tax=Neomoorella thermoacetica TaxID=1525 RepID=A0AAC9HG20_NEOTH|nr:hypothetical protein [Moorella thermoacetica]AOQ23093.1 hypothetical protein Maut_00630 [Moorella thermoacetica]TYL08940.1 hypothetical protein MTAT_26040 [Moorella thermoacetica]
MLSVHKLTRVINDCERGPDGVWRVVRRRRVPLMVAETDDPRVMAVLERLERELNPAADIVIEVNNYVVGEVIDEE